MSRFSPRLFAIMNPDHTFGNQMGETQGYDSFRATALPHSLYRHIKFVVLRQQGHYHNSLPQQHCSQQHVYLA